MDNSGNTHSCLCKREREGEKNIVEAEGIQQSKEHVPFNYLFPSLFTKSQAIPQFHNVTTILPHSKSKPISHLLPIIILSHSLSSMA